MLEKTLENQLRQAVERAGGLCLKWTCPGRRGVPDRMVLFPGGVLVFVELKRPGDAAKTGHRSPGKVSALQNFWHSKLRQYGFGVEVISQPDEIAPFVAQCVLLSRERREVLDCDL